MREIFQNGEITTDKDGRKWLPVMLSNEAASQLNKIILGDREPDEGSLDEKLRKQVHDDCLFLFKAFN